jgi:hypothetical protein
MSNGAGIERQKILGKLPRAKQDAFWDAIAAGQEPQQAAASAGVKPIGWANPELIATFLIIRDLKRRSKFIASRIPVEKRIAFRDAYLNSRSFLAARDAAGLTRYQNAACFNVVFRYVRLPVIRFEELIPGDGSKKTLEG